MLLIAIAAGGAGGYWLGSQPSKTGSSAARGDTAVEQLKAAFDSAVSGEPDQAPSAPLSAAETEALIEDPLRSIDAALALPETGKRRNQLLRLGDTWARAAPEDAWQEALRMADPQARRILTRAVIPVWAEQQPERAFASVAELPPSWDRTQLLQRVSVEIARRDPLLALNLVSSLKQPDTDSYRASILREWSRYDPGGAAQWIERQDVRVQGLAYQIVDAYVAQQPQEALDWALRMSRTQGSDLWRQMLRKMAVYEPEEALRITLATENPVQRNNALASVLSSVATTNPALATSYLDRIPSGHRRTRVLMDIASSLAEKSPALAVEWANSLEDARMRTQAWEQLGGAIAYRDPDAAAELLDRAPHEARVAVISTIAAAYAQTDPNKAIQWVRRFQDEPGYPRIMQQVTMNLPHTNPELALDIVNRAVEGKQREQVLARMIPMIAHNAPESAALLLDEVSDETLRSQSIGMVARAWAQSDLAAARKWLTSLPAGPSRDQALMGMAGSAVATADETLSLVNQIQAPDVRQRAVYHAALRLAQANREEMRTLLRRRPLDPQHQAQLDSTLKHLDEGIPYRYGAQ